jgi:hypothetical protein
MGMKIKMIRWIWTHLNQMHLLLIIMVSIVNTTKLLSDLFFTDDELEDEEPWDLEYEGSDEEALDDEEPLDNEDPLDDEEPSDDEESLDDEELLDDEEPSQDKYIYNSEGESEIDLDNEDDGPTGNTVY